jgi:hypothetical protein
MPGCFPTVRLGEWVVESEYYVCLTPEGKPQKFNEKKPVTFTSQKDGFVFAIEPDGVTDGWGVWKVDGSKCSNQLILVNDKVGQIGTLTLNINKRDKKRRVTKFVGNYIQSGFIPGLLLANPLCGIINAYWVKDL